MDTISRGNAAEAAVLRRLALADIPAYLPFGGGSPVDLIALVPPEGEAVRIQVKSGRVRKGCVQFNTCSTDHGAGPQSYEGRADVIAVDVPGLDRVFIMRVSECPSSKGWLRLDRPRNNQRKRVRFAADYTFERWLESLGQTTTPHEDEDAPLASLIRFPEPAPF